MANQPQYKQQTRFVPGREYDVGFGNRALASTFNKIGDTGYHFANEGLAKDSQNASALLRKAQSENTNLKSGKLRTEINSDIDKASTQLYGKGYQATQEINSQLIAKQQLDNAAKKFTEKGINGDSIVEFSKASDEIKSSLMNGVSDSVKPQLSNVADYYSNQIKADMFKTVDQQQRNDLRATFFSYLNQNESDVQQAYLNRDEINGNAFVVQSLQKIDIGLREALISPKEYAVYKARIESNGVTNYQLGRFNRALEEGTGKEYMQAFVNDENYTIEERTKIAQQMKTQMNLRTKMNQLNETNINQEIKQSVDFLKNGGDIANIQPIISNVANNYPDKLPELLSQVQYAEVFQATAKQLSLANPIEAQSTFDGIAAAKEAANKKGDIQAFNMLSQLEKESRSDYQVQYNKFKNDPASWVENQDQYQFIKNSYQTASVDSESNVISSNKVNASLDDTKINMQRQRGLDESRFSILPKDQASQFSAQIMAEPSLIKQVTTINELLSQHPGYENVVLRDLRNSGLGRANTLFLGMQQNPASRANMALVAQALETKDIKLDNVKQIDIYNDVDSNLKDLYNSTTGLQNTDPNSISDIRDTVAKVASYLASPLGGNLSSSKAAEKASDLVVNNQYSFETLHGKTLRIPYGVDPSIAINSANSFYYQTIGTDDFYVPPEFENKALTPEQNREIYRADIKSNGGIVSSSDGQGFIIVDSQNNPVLNLDGSPYKISFKDAVNHPITPIETKTSNYYQKKGFYGAGI